MARRCANCPGRVIPSYEHDAAALDEHGEWWTHVGRTSDVPTWCDEPRPKSDEEEPSCP